MQNYEHKINLAPVKKKNGRPKGSTKLKPDAATLKQIEKLGGLQCTHIEAAAVLGVSRPTFESFLGRHKEVREAWENGKGKARASLRRNQFKLASSGNSTMQIWLGKQYLGQRNQPQTTNVLVNLTDEQLNARLQQLLEKASVQDAIGGPIIDGQVAEGNQQAGGDAVAGHCVRVTGGSRRVPSEVRARVRKTG